MKGKQLVYILLLVLANASCKEKKSDYDASGSFEAVETMISAEANGKILQFKIEEGQLLDSGQLVGYLDSTQLHLSRLQLAQNKKAILSNKPGVTIQTEALKKELQNAIADRNRTENLVKGGVAAQRQLDDATAKVATLQAKIEAQENSLETTTSSINEQGGNIDAQVKILDEQINKYLIINPVKGTVLAKYAEPHEMVVAGKPLYKIADLSTIVLRAYITGDQLSQVKIGQQVKVSSDDGQGGFKNTDGKITWINDISEFTPKTIQTKNERSNLVYAIKVSVKNDGYLKLGMYGQVSWNK